jgi:hypothetical protein
LLIHCSHGFCNLLRQGRSPDGAKRNPGQWPRISLRFIRATSLGRCAEGHCIFATAGLKCTPKITYQKCIVKRKMLHQGTPAH